MLAAGAMGNDDMDLEPLQERRQMLEPTCCRLEKPDRTFQGELHFLRAIRAAQDANGPLFDLIGHVLQAMWVKLVLFTTLVLGRTASVPHLCWKLVHDERPTRQADQIAPLALQS